jgi:sulfatase maturation enzyme AslB (radical SAM superfamily)
LTADITLFTNGSRIDWAFLDSYPGRITLVFSLDATAEQAQYIRFGTEWHQVLANFEQARRLTAIDLRVNITVSVYNYLYLADLMQLLAQDWPGVVTFGSPRDPHLTEAAVPWAARSAMIDQLRLAQDHVQAAAIEPDQRANAIQALDAHCRRLATEPFDPTAHQRLVNFIGRMDQVKQTDIRQSLPQLVDLLAI